MITARNYRRWILAAGLIHYAVSFAAFTAVYFWILSTTPEDRRVHWIYAIAVGASELLVWWPLTLRWLERPHQDLLACQTLPQADAAFAPRAEQMVRGYISGFLKSVLLAWFLYYGEGLVAILTLLFYYGEPWNRVLVVSSTFMTCVAVFQVSRLFYMGLILNPVLDPVVPEERFLFRFRVSYRLRMFVAATLIGLVSTSLFILYAWFFIGFDFQTLVFYAYVPAPLSIVFITIVGAVIWHQTRPIQAFLLESERSGRVRDPALVREAFASATRFPYRANNYVWMIMWATVGALILYLQVAFIHTPPTDAAVMLSGIGITSIGVCLYQMNWFRRILRTLLRHISAEYPGFRFEDLPPGLGMKAKLLLTFVGLLVFALTFAYVTSYQQHLTVVRAQYGREALRWVEAAAQDAGEWQDAPAAEVQERLRRMGRGHSGYLVLASADGTQVSAEGTPITGSELADLAQANSPVWDLRAGRKTTARRALPDGALLVAVIPWDQALFTPVGFVPNLFFFAGLLLITLGAVVYSANELSGPLAELTASARAIARGDLDHPVPYGEPDEIGTLAHQFEEMRRALRGKIADLERANEEIRHAQSRLLEQERLATIGKMASAIAHEIRNPLSSVKMNLQILERHARAAPADARHYQIAIGEVDRLDRIVGDLLLYAKPLPLRRALVRASDLIASAVAASQAHLNAKKIAASISVDPEDLSFPADAERLQQVLLNLILNAAQASPEGATVRIEGAREGAEVVFRVRDQGMGIAEENLPRIFDPFFTTKADGTGLGLAIARKIALAHGGDLRAQSARGSGTAFEIRLPV